MRKLRTLLFAFVLSTASTASMTAFAQQDAALTEAQARFKEGLDLADANNHEAARLKFQQAYSVYKSPAVLYNLARSEQLTGHDIEAFEHFREFLKSPPDPKVTEAHKKKAQENAEELAKKLGQVDVQAPPNARITVDGKIAPEAARDPVPVAPGRHVIEATLEGRIKSIAVECTAGNVTKAKIEFETTTGGSGAGTGSGFTEPPPAGGDDDRTSSARYVVPAILGVAGLASLGIGMGFGLASQAAKDEEDSLRKPGVCNDRASGDCQTLQAKSDDVTSKGTISTIGYVGGGVLLAAAVVTYIVWPSSKKSASGITVTPVASANGGMLHLGGSFQ
jgi:hypothetical protein